MLLYAAGPQLLVYNLESGESNPVATGFKDDIEVHDFEWADDSIHVIYAVEEKGLNYIHYEKYGDAGKVFSNDIHNVLASQVIVYNNGVLLGKNGEYPKFYKVETSTCPQGYEISNPSLSNYHCELACDSSQKRVFLDGAKCWSSCPPGYKQVKHDFSDKMTEDICIPEFCTGLIPCYTSESYRSFNILLAFDRHLNQSAMNDTLCLVSSLSMIGSRLYRADTNEGCALNATTARLLLHTPRELQSDATNLPVSGAIQYLIAVNPNFQTLTGDISRRIFESRPKDLIMAFNQRKNASHPVLVNISIVDYSLIPAVETKLNWTTPTKNFSLVDDEKNISINLQFENITFPTLVYLGYYIESFSRTRKLDIPQNLVMGVDNNGSAIDFLYSNISDAKGNVEFVIPAPESESRLKVLWTLKTLGQKNALLDRVEFYNYRIRRTSSFSIIKNGVGLLSIILIILAIFI